MTQLEYLAQFSLQSSKTSEDRVGKHFRNNLTEMMTEWNICKFVTLYLENWLYVRNDHKQTTFFLLLTLLDLC